MRIASCWAAAGLGLVALATVAASGTPGDAPKIANVRTVGGIVFAGSPLAASKEELQTVAGYWPDIEQSRAEAKRLLKEAGAEGLSFQLLNRGADQPYKLVGTWLVDEWSKIRLKLTQRVMPTGPWIDAMRRGDFDVVSQANCHGVPNPLTDVQPYLPASVYTANYGQFEDPTEVDLYSKMLREIDFARKRALMREFGRYVVDTQAHEIFGLCGTGSFPTRAMSKAGRSARAMTSIRI